MKAEVKILVEYNHIDDTVFLSSRGVEGDGLPLNVYIGMLQALCRMQKQYNDRQLEITLTPPSEVSLASEIPAPPPRIEVPDVSKEGTPPSPPPAENSSEVAKRPKPYTVEEKTEIAMMYESGMNVMAIAEKFGREPSAIRILMSKMGVKRGNENPNQESDGEKKESALKKPWYLQNQRMMQGRKQNKE